VPENLPARSQSLEAKSTSLVKHGSGTDSEQKEAVKFVAEAAVI
jgi:hypothetical protein